MSDFWIYFEIGLKHVLNLGSYDHLLFLMALAIPHAFKDWKKILVLVTVFSVGHTLALVASVFEIVTIKAQLVELLIPVTILAAAVSNFFAAGKNTKNEAGNAVVLMTLFFGVIHGLGFSNYFKSILPGTASEKIIPLLEFALGIEISQVIVVLAVLTVTYTLQTFFRFSKRDCTIVASAFIIGVVLPMILQNEIWN